ncbi:MAG: hypothetical protein AAF441_07740 [Pseudomonadota bacterium]
MQLRTFTYSFDSGLSYAFSPHTRFNVDFAKWSVQLGMTTRLPPIN